MPTKTQKTQKRENVKQQQQTKRTTTAATTTTTACNNVAGCNFARCILWTSSNTRIYHKLQRIRRTADRTNAKRGRKREESERERTWACYFGGRRVPISATFVSHNFAVFSFKYFSGFFYLRRQKSTGSYPVR